MTRAEKMAKNRISKRIAAAYNARCMNIQIPIMETVKIYKIGEAAIAAEPALTDAALGDKIAAYVETIRCN